MPTCMWRSIEVADLSGVRRLRHQLADLLEWLAWAHQCHISYVQRERILLLQTELMTNSVKYAHPHARYIGFHCWQRRGRLWLEWHDDGGRFNPLAQPSSIGVHVNCHGYGLYLIQILAPQIQYRATFGQNRYWLPLP